MFSFRLLYLPLLLFCLLLCAPLAAQQNHSDGSDSPSPPPMETAASLPDSPGERFSDHLQNQASLEVEIGLRLFNEGDDYRAITALKRYRLLQASPSSDHLANLLIGEIYRRNEYPDLAMHHFFDAARLGETLGARDALSTYHLGIQEFCLSLRAYATCHKMLDDLEQAYLSASLTNRAELARYQRHFIEFLFRTPRNAPMEFDDPHLHRASEELFHRHQVFDDLPLKNTALAGLLSAVLPGAGQAYNGRWLDAGLAMGFTAAFAGATAYSHYRLESLPLTILSGIFTLGFYAGNITNAVVDARRINASIYDDFFETLQGDLWPRSSFQVNHGEVHYDYHFDWPAHREAPVSQEPPPLPNLL